MTLNMKEKSKQSQYESVLKPTSLHVLVKHCTFKAVSVGPHQYNLMWVNLNQLRHWSHRQVQVPVCRLEATADAFIPYFLFKPVSKQPFPVAMVKAGPPHCYSLQDSARNLWNTSSILMHETKHKLTDTVVEKQYFQALSKQMSTFWMIWLCKKMSLYNSCIKCSQVHWWTWFCSAWRPKWVHNIDCSYKTPRKLMTCRERPVVYCNLGVWNLGY